MTNPLFDKYHMICKKGCFQLKIKTDSRKVLPGDTFIALKGIKTDGHKYVKEAIKNGASLVIVER